MSSVVDVDDPADPRLDDFRDLNSIDRRPDLPSGKGLVIAEGVLVVQRMLASRFRPRAMLGTDRRLRRTGGRPRRRPTRPYYRVTAEVMADVVGFHLNRGVLAAAPRPGELSVAEVLDGARTVAVLEGVNDHENLGSIFRNAAGLGVDARGVRHRLRRPAVPPRRTRLDGACPLGAVCLGCGMAGRTLTSVARQRFSRCWRMTPDASAPTLAEAMATLLATTRRDSRRRRGPRADRDGDAGQRCAGADSDVTGHRLTQCGDGGGAGVLRAG